MERDRRPLFLSRDEREGEAGRSVSVVSADTLRLGGPSQEIESKLVVSC